MFGGLRCHNRLFAHAVTSLQRKLQMEAKEVILNIGQHCCSQGTDQKPPEKKMACEPSSAGAEWDNAKLTLPCNYNGLYCLLCLVSR